MAWPWRRKQKVEQFAEKVRTVLQEVAVADPRRLFADGINQYNPSILVTRKGLAVFDTMRRDDQVKACMAFKKHAVLSTGWEVVSPPGESEEWEVKEFVRIAFERMTGTLEDSLLGILSALDYGYSVSEIVHREEDGRITLDKLKTVSPHQISLKTDAHGNLIEIQQFQSEYGYQGKLLPPEKFIVFQNQPEFGNPYGHSDLEACYRPWLIKDNSYKWMAMALERRGIPPFFLLYDPNRYQGQILSDLKSVVKNLAASTVGTIPKPSPDSLEFHEMSGIADTRNIFASSIDMFNRDISRALLVPSLIGVTGGDSELGSYARANVHFNSFILILEYLRGRLAEYVINECLIRRLVDLNFAGVREYPIFRFLPYQDAQRLDMLKAWLEYLRIGAVTPGDDDERYLRAALGMPEREEQPAEVEPEEGGDEGQTPPVEPEGEPGETPPASSEQPQMPPTKASMKFAAQKFRSGESVQVIKMALDGLETDAKGELIKALTVTRDQLVAWWMRHHERLKPSDIFGELPLKNMGEVQNILGEMLRVSYERGYKSSPVGLRRMQQSVFTPTKALQYLNSRKFWISGVLKRQIEKEAQALLANAMKTGELPKETAQKLEAMFAKYLGDGIAYETEKGYEVGTPHHIETIIRTNVTDAYNHGRLVSFMEAGPDVVGGVEYSAILDERTTEQCRALDGHVFAANDPNLTRFTPPLHYNCRSLLVPVEAGEPIKESEMVTAELVGKLNELVPADFGGSA